MGRRDRISVMTRRDCANSRSPKFTIAQTAGVRNLQLRKQLGVRKL